MSTMREGAQDKEWLEVAEVAAYLGVEPVTVYRWCRARRLPCIKLGKAWRIRRAALEEFLRQAEQASSLIGRLRDFYTVPDHVIAISETEELQYQLDAAFLQVGEVRGGMLVKCYSAKTRPVDELRRQLARCGVEVGQLEAGGRLRLVEQGDPVHGRVAQLRELRAALLPTAGPVWVSFDWTHQVTVDEALSHQAALADLLPDDHLVIQTGVLERITDDWPLVHERRVRQLHRGVIWLSTTSLSLSRKVALPG